jgi:DNA-binding IclR family transcriptional regulator
VSETSLPEPVAALIRAAITSIWALELLLLVKGRPDQAWTVEQLVRELRGSFPLITDLAITLHRAGLLMQEGEAFRYRPANEALRSAADALERLSSEKPMAIRQAILAAPHDKVQVFADAFRIKRS